MKEALEKVDDILYNFEREHKEFHYLFKSILDDLEMSDANKKVITKLFELEELYNLDKYELVVTVFNGENLNN